MVLFTEPAERAKAMGVFGFVMSGGGTIGVLLGGVLTDVLNWHWIFLVNIPIGIAVFVTSLKLLPAAPGHAAQGRLDVGGAITVTTALMLAVYAIVNGNDAGWGSTQTLGLLALSLRAARVFLVIESRVSAPLMPLSLFKLRNVATANVVGVLWAAAMFAWFFLSALYLQLVLGYSPLEGRPRLPADEPDHGRALGRPLGEARDALRRPAAARRRADARRGRARALRARAGRRQLRRRRPAADDPARDRRRDRVQPAAARRDERCRAAGVGPRLGRRQHRRS